MTATPAKKILLIEDDDVIREVMKELLESEGYQVTCAINGDEGLKALRCEELPRLILLDMTMPVKDGMQFREEQIQDARLSQIPVVLMTADGDVAAKTLKVGAKCFIRKPFDIDVVIRTVEEYCA